MNVNENLIIENVTQVKRITINANASAKSKKTSYVWNKHTWNLSTCTCGNGKYKGIII